MLLTVSSSAVDIKFNRCFTRKGGLLRGSVSTDGRQTLVKQCRRRVGTVGNDRSVQTYPSRYKGVQPAFVSPAAYSATVYL